MNPSARREEDLFAEVLALPAGERGAFLARIGDIDPALRLRIEALLAAHDTPGSVLLPPAAVQLPSPAEQPGDHIDRYRLLQKIGEGGCGVVYLAEQQEPVHRRVALKVIKLGMDTKEVIARFEAERQALARMDHPHIARVFDAGATASGRPYFVMELVRGVRITDFCDGHSSSTAQRLELFIQVCHAVQHAHQKGIIHRDLKPSNILVTINDGVPVPKIIDFGIAKATQGRLTDQTVFTAFEQFIGTPVYMSPEQAELTSLDIDTRSDIYSLGVLLYELLTGRTPFDAKALVQAGLDEIRRLIREVEPPKPSSRLSTMEGKTLTLMAQRRHTEPPKLISLVRGDLDWIVMRCLEKDRTRRYDTPTALAADLGRHLKHEPVAARPPSSVYRLGKFIRRHRIGFAATVGLALALVLGTAISLWQAVRARQAEDLARNEQASALDLVSFMLVDLGGRLKEVGRLDLLDVVGRKSLEYLGTRAPRDLTDVSLGLRTNALTQIGDAQVIQTKYPEAEKAYLAAYAVAAELARRHPQDVARLHARGLVEFGLGHVAYRRGELKPARTWFGRYHDTTAALVALERGNPRWQRELAAAQQTIATVNRDEGSLAAAREGFLGALGTLNGMLATAPADIELLSPIAEITSFLGSLAERMGDYPEAVRRYGEQVTRYEAIRTLASDNPKWKYKVAEGLGFQASVLAITGQRAAAQPLLAQARALLEPLVVFDATNRQWRSALLMMKLKTAMLLHAGGDAAQALPLVESVRQAFAQALVSEPADWKSKSRLANAWRVEAEVRHTLRRGDAAAAAQEAEALGAALVGSGQRTPDHVAELAQARIIAGRIAAAQGERARALERWHRALEVLEPALTQTSDWRLLDPAARVAALLGRVEDARTRISQLTQLGYVPLEPWPNPDVLGACEGEGVSPLRGGS